MERTKNEVGVDVKKLYVAPKIEVIHLDETPGILSASVGASYQMGFDDVYETDWDE